MPCLGSSKPNSALHGTLSSSTSPVQSQTIRCWQRLSQRSTSQRVRLMQSFWPGPLTLLLPRSRAVPDAVTAGRPLVGVRMPAHPVAFEVIRQAGVPIAAPSANVFGHISPTSAEHVLDDLDGRIDAILDAGPTHHGVESTVLDPCQSPSVIYRPGAITAEQIQHLVGSVAVFAPGDEERSAAPDSLPSPGISLRHYAPRARLVLVDASFAELPAKLLEAAKPFEKQRLGIMLPTELTNTELGAPLRAAAEFPWGRLGLATGVGKQPLFRLARTRCSGLHRHTLSIAASTWFGRGHPRPFAQSGLSHRTVRLAPY